MDLLSTIQQDLGQLYHVRQCRRLRCKKTIIFLMEKINCIVSVQTTDQFDLLHRIRYFPRGPSSVPSHPYLFQVSISERLITFPDSECDIFISESDVLKIFMRTKRALLSKQTFNPSTFLSL